MTDTNECSFFFFFFYQYNFVFSSYFLFLFRILLCDLSYYKTSTITSTNTTSVQTPVVEKYIQKAPKCISWPDCQDPLWILDGSRPQGRLMGKGKDDMKKRMKEKGGESVESCMYLYPPSRNAAYANDQHHHYLQ